MPTAAVVRVDTTVDMVRLILITKILFIVLVMAQLLIHLRTYITLNFPSTTATNPTLRNFTMITNGILILVIGIHIDAFRLGLTLRHLDGDLACAIFSRYLDRVLVHLGALFDGLPPWVHFIRKRPHTRRLVHPHRTIVLCILTLTYQITKTDHLIACREEHHLTHQPEETDATIMTTMTLHLENEIGEKDTKTTKIMIEDTLQADMETIHIDIQAIQKVLVHAQDHRTTH